MYLDTDKRVIKRERYGLLAYLADVGGFMILVYLLSQFIMNCYTTRVMDSLLLSSLFELKSEMSAGELVNKLQADLTNQAKPETPRLLCPYDSK